MSKFLDVAIAAAKKAGAIHLRYYNSGMRVFSKGAIDVVTNADLESEKTVVSEIRKSFPDHNILTEESSQRQTNSEYRWILDPLDATANFFRRIPLFSVSIALQRNDETIVGVVYDSKTNELFYAEKGKGAFLNGKRIHVSTGTPRKFLVDIISYPECSDTTKKRGTDAMRMLLEKNYEVRLLYGAALPLVYVAAGKLDASVSLQSDVFGAAAGKLIVQESGGVVVNDKGQMSDDAPWRGTSKSVIAVGNPKVKSKIMEVIK
jgi:myo-inositol-1(or 4)-monophosphatase